MLSLKGPHRERSLCHLLCLSITALCVTGTSSYAGTLDRDFDTLRSPDAMADTQVRDQVIQRSFSTNNPATLTFVTDKLWRRPATDLYQDTRAVEIDAVVARTILGAMPINAQEGLLEDIPQDPFKKARLLEAAGEFKTSRALQVLSQSLTDTRVSGLPLSLTDGWSLRVCDVAYNTLVHRLRLTELRSPLGTGFAISSRDRWVGRLQEWLKENQDKMGN